MANNTWFRFYSEALDDPKVQFLPDHLFKFWVNLLCLANKQSDRGTLPAAVSDIAWALRLDLDTVTKNLECLRAQGLLDWSEDGGQYQPHNWQGRQFKSDDVNARVEKFRAKERSYNKEDETLHETLHETDQNRADTESYTDTESTYVLTNIEAKEKTGVVQVDSGVSQAKTPIRAKTPRVTSFPDSFRVTPKLELWAAENVPELDIGVATEEWEGSMRANRTKYRYTDWDQAWRNAMKLAAKWQKERGGRNGQSNSSRAYTGTNGSPKDEATARSIRATMERREARRAGGGDQEKPPVGRSSPA